MRVIKAAVYPMVICTILLRFCFPGMAQPADLNKEGGMGVEKYRILTDRSIYITGEAINFRVFNLNPDSLRKLSWSRVFYLELISPDGLPHAQGKYSMGLSGTESFLRVPGDLPSGTYYLKGYSRWMRNFGPASYCYLSIEIVNLVNQAVLSVDTTSNFTLPLLKRNFEPNSAGSDVNPVSAFPAANGFNSMTGSYVKRAAVQLNLSLDRDEPSVSCCVTVIRSGCLRKQWESESISHGNNISHMVQIPETKGISITGKIVLAGSGLPVPYSVVYISLMGKNKEFYCNYADSLGRFYMAFPNHYGEEELFISASSQKSANLEIAIDNDFCAEPVSLPSYPIKLDQFYKKLISDLSMNAQIREQYYTGQLTATETVPEKKMFFYGNPSAVIKFDDFIRLPTMEEYFSEVTPEVSLYKSNGTNKFRVHGEHQDLEFYEPLVMIDGVTIFDIESILNLSPRLIDRIEIVDAPYVKGNVTFGGIIHIISRNNDMGFIDLPASGLLVSYKMFQTNQHFDQITQPVDPRLPDVRNTLLWNPRVDLASGEETEINFQTPDTKGYFQLLIRGYTSHGTYFERSFPFRVN